MKNPFKTLKGTMILSLILILIIPLMVVSFIISSTIVSELSKTVVEENEAITKAIALHVEHFFHKHEELLNSISYYYIENPDKIPRYYQLNAINRTIEAIAKGQDRILLVMATGTGKTFTAFQIIWRLWKSGAKKRILYLADRNILIDQTRINDFKPFGSVMTKLTNHKIDTAYEIYLAIYQAITGTEECQKSFRKFSRDFFDLVIVDECHRSIYNQWSQVLEYFDSFIIGLTATPSADTLGYFNQNLVMEYSHERAVADGVNVGYDVYYIETAITKDGSRIPRGYNTWYRDVHTREELWQMGDEE